MNGDAEEPQRPQELSYARPMPLPAEAPAYKRYSPPQLALRIVLAVLIMGVLFVAAFAPWMQYLRAW